eukprot:2890656-Rhodomonas_salina.1
MQISEVKQVAVPSRKTGGVLSTLSATSYTLPTGCPGLTWAPTVPGGEGVVHTRTHVKFENSEDEEGQEEEEGEEAMKEYDSNVIGGDEEGGGATGVDQAVSGTDVAYGATVTA